MIRNRDGTLTNGEARRETCLSYRLRVFIWSVQALSCLGSTASESAIRIVGTDAINDKGAQRWCVRKQRQPDDP